MWSKQCLAGCMELKFLRTMSWNQYGVLSLPGLHLSSVCSSEAQIVDIGLHWSSLTYLFWKWQSGSSSCLIWGSHAVSSVTLSCNHTTKAQAVWGPTRLWMWRAHVNKGCSSRRGVPIPPNSILGLHLRVSSVLGHPQETGGSVSVTSF